MFSTFYNSSYATVLLSYGVMVPEDIYFKRSLFPVMAQMMYISMLGILFLTMLNLLIALVSDTVSQINRFKSLVVRLQTIAALMYLEDINVYSKCKRSSIMGRSIPSLYNLFSKRPNLIFSTDGEQVYLHTVVEHDHIQASEKAFGNKPL